MAALVVGQFVFHVDTCEVKFIPVLCVNASVPLKFHLEG